MELNLAHGVGWLDSGEDPGLPGQPPRLVWAGSYAGLAALTPIAPLTHVQKPGAQRADPQREVGQGLVPFKGGVIWNCSRLEGRSL